MNKVYMIDCPNCGVIPNNNSSLYCDHCGNPVERIRLGEFWYNAEELEEENIYC
jgi:ribosomal protein L37E